MLETCRRAGAVPSGPQLAAAPGAPARTRHPPRAQAARARGRVVNAACHIQRIFTGPSGPQSAACWRHSRLAGDRTAVCGRQRAPGITRPLRQQRRIMSDVPPRRLRLPLLGAHAASHMRVRQGHIGRCCRVEPPAPTASQAARQQRQHRSKPEKHVFSATPRGELCCAPNKEPHTQI